MAGNANLERVISDWQSGRLNRRQLIRLALAAGVTLAALPQFLAACGGDDEAPSAGSTAPAGSTTSGGGATTPAAGAQSSASPAAQSQAIKRGGTLTIARPIDSVALDPYKDITGPSAYVYSNLYETLVKFDTDLQLKPGLAERWEQQGPDRWLRPRLVRRGHPLLPLPAAGHRDRGSAGYWRPQYDAGDWPLVNPGLRPCGAQAGDQPA